MSTNLSVCAHWFPHSDRISKDHLLDSFFFFLGFLVPKHSQMHIHSCYCGVPANYLTTHPPQLHPKRISKRLDEVVIGVAAIALNVNAQIGERLPLHPLTKEEMDPTEPEAQQL